MFAPPPADEERLQCNDETTFEEPAGVTIRTLNTPDPCPLYEYPTVESPNVRAGGHPGADVVHDRDASSPRRHPNLERRRHAGRQLDHAGKLGRDRAGDERPADLHRRHAYHGDE